MKKPDSLRAHLLAAIPQLRRSPDQLLIFIDQGSARSTAARGLSFEYRYTLNLMLTDFAGSPDAVFIPLLAWLGVHQHELLASFEQNAEGIGFEVDVIDAGKVDLSITLPLTERVIVKRQPGGQLLVEYPQEPQLEPFLPAGTWQVYSGAELLAEWQSTEQEGGDLAMPHPPRRG
ncbi:phage tail protein [Pseudomonas paralcaligenes]|uniref:phage tail protein n=1 Tax=Pseudomonas paralcaligenes TaxID=2772558 RepID=UPI001C7E9042|nr:phage tail protein [Pseudomonas paralcaligenes]